MVYFEKWGMSYVPRILYKNPLHLNFLPRTQHLIKYFSWASFHFVFHPDIRFNVQTDLISFVIWKGLYIETIVWNLHIFGAYKRLSWIAIVTRSSSWILFIRDLTNVIQRSLFRVFIASAATLYFIRFMLLGIVQKLNKWILIIYLLSNWIKSRLILLWIYRVWIYPQSCVAD